MKTNSAVPSDAVSRPGIARPVRRFYVAGLILLALCAVVVLLQSGFGRGPYTGIYWLEVKQGLIIAPLTAAAFFYTGIWLGMMVPGVLVREHIGWVQRFLMTALTLVLILAALTMLGPVIGQMFGVTITHLDTARTDRSVYYLAERGYIAGPMQCDYEAAPPDCQQGQVYRGRAVALFECGRLGIWCQNVLEIADTVGSSDPPPASLEVDTAANEVRIVQSSAILGTYHIEP